MLKQVLKQRYSTTKLDQNRKTEEMTGEMSIIYTQIITGSYVVITSALKKRRKSMKATLNHLLDVQSGELASQVLVPEQ